MTARFVGQKSSNFVSLNLNFYYAMKINIANSLGLFVIALLCTNFSFAQITGINQSYVVLDYNGTLEYFQGEINNYNFRNAPDFNSHYLGTFSQLDNITLTGAELHTFQSGAGDVTGAELSYAIYPSAGAAQYSTIAIPFCCSTGDTNPCNLGESCSSGASGDKRWSNSSAAIDILSGLDPGEYTIRVAFTAFTNLGDRFDSNPGNGDFQATFTVGSEGFLDGDLTSGTHVWSGETESYTILNPAIDSATGVNSFINLSTETNNQVLVSNPSTPDAVITTPSSQAYGTWQFSCATSDNWNTSSANGFKVILMSDTDDPQKLKDGSFDFNGYLVEFGQSGSNDYFKLVRVTGFGKFTLIQTSYPGESGAELGYRVKVTRDLAGNWELFADQGFDGPAASTSRGVSNDNTTVTSSYFALTTEISSNPNKRVFYDNISLNGPTKVSFENSSFTYNESENSASVSVFIESPSMILPTFVDVVLTSGDDSRLENFSSQTVTFPAGSSALQSISLDIFDNLVCDYNTSFTFELQNVFGGVNAIISERNTHDLFIEDDDTASETNRFENLENGNLTNWIGDIGSFSNQTTNELSGEQALYTNATGDVQLSLPSPYGDLSGGITTWEFSVATSQKDPNRTNRFMVFLTSDNPDLNSPQINGYAVGVNAVNSLLSQDAADRLKLYRISNGFATPLITFEEPNGLGFYEELAIKIIRTENGIWSMYVNEDKDFEQLEYVGETVDDSYEFFGNFGIVSYKSQEDEVDTSWTNWEVWLDDISINQEFCSGQYETTDSGDPADNIWQLVGSTTPATPPFNKYTDITVKDGNSLVLTEKVRVGQVNIETGATLDLGLNNELEVAKDLTIDGNLNASKGAVSLIGNTGNQQISGGSTPTFYELNIVNLDGVIFSTDANFYGPIHPERGTLEFGAQDITLASADIDGEILTGSISEIKPGADVAGQITMERYLETNTDGFRIIGLPITGQTLEAFNDDFITTGFPGSDFPDFTFPGNPDPTYVNLTTYDETLAGSSQEGYVPVENITENINDEKAYMGYFPPEASNYTFDGTGDFRKGDVTFDLTYTENNGNLSDGWHMIPNPYPSAIDMNSPAITYSNVQIAAYVLDNTLGDWRGEWRSWVAGTSNNGGSNILSSYQGFFIKATAENASITFREGCKVDDQAGYIRTEDATRQILRFSLNQGENNYETTLSFHDQATDEFDEEFDGYFFGEAPAAGSYAIATKNGDDYLSINTLAELTEDLSVPFRIAAATPGTYTLKLEDEQNILSSVCLLIEDTETQELYPVGPEFEHTFNVLDEDYVTDRFVLHAKPGATFESQMASCFGSEDGEINFSAPNYTNWNIEWFDNANTLVSSSTENNMTLTGLAAGVYKAVMTNSDLHCNALEQEVTVIQPPLEEIFIMNSSSLCSDETGEISVYASNSSEWTSAVIKDGDLVEEKTQNELIYHSYLEGGTYVVQVSTGCSFLEETVDISDVNATEASFNADLEVTIVNGLGDFQATNTSANSVYSEWYLDGELISQEENFSYQFLVPGEHELVLVSSNEFCTSEYSEHITVTIMDSVNENELEIDIINLDSEFVVQSNNFQNLRVEVYDISGKLLLSKRINSSSNSISKEDWSTGIYTLVISKDSKIIKTKKLKL